MQRKEVILKSLLVVALYFGITYLLSLNNYIFGRDLYLFSDLDVLPFILRDFFVTRLDNLIIISTCLVYFIFIKVFMNRHKSFENINDLVKLAGLFVFTKGLFDSLVFLSKILENIYIFDRPVMDFGSNSTSVFTILFELLFGFALFFIFRKDNIAQENGKKTFRYQVRIIAIYFALLSLLRIVGYCMSTFLYPTLIGSQELSPISNTVITVLIQLMTSVIPFIIGLIILVFTRDIPRTVNPQKNYFSYIIVALILQVIEIRLTISIIRFSVTIPGTEFDFLSTWFARILAFSVIFLLVFFAEKRLRAHKH